ncbi:MAG: hypothetical protein WC058_10745 [Phycisphaeraceae bacterium]
MPTSGTFEGYYHRDRMGVGHFGYFYVASELHPQLAAYDGKLIRLQFTKAEQLMNPGPSVIQAIGRIEVLPQPPLKLSITTRPSPVIAGQPFEMLVKVTDTRRPGAEPNPAGLTPNCSMVRFLQPSQPTDPHPDQPSALYLGYTPRQLAVESHGGQVDYTAWPFERGRPNLTTCGVPLELRPADAWTWIVYFPKDAATTDGEAHVTGEYLIAGETPGEHGRTVIRLETWQDISVRPATTTWPVSIPANDILRLADAKFTFSGEDGWSEVRLKVQPAWKQEVRVPATVDARDDEVLADTYANIGRLEAFTTDGTPVELEVQRIADQYPPNTARNRMVHLPLAGVNIVAKFRKRSRFAPKIAKLSAGFVTEQGTGTLILSPPYDDPDVSPATPFGESIDGVKLRIRPAVVTFNVGAPVTFCAQAVNTSGQPVCWWMPYDGDGENCVVLMDGKALRLSAEKAKYIRGWATQRLVGEPAEWTFTLPKSIALTKGRHTLGYIIMSNGGTYMNANNQPIPLVNGKLIANVTTFVVE